MLAALAVLPTPERVASLVLIGTSPVDKALATALARRAAALPALAHFQLRGLSISYKGLGRLLRCLAGAPALATLDLGCSGDANNELLEALSGGGWQKLQVRGAARALGS